MKLLFKKISLHKSFRAFSLIEVTAALLILAIIGASVMVVINRCIDSVIDSQLKMEAFELARENMEKLLASVSVKETIEYGISGINQEIQWETVVESFYEPITSRMWIRALCSASYVDSKDEEQKVELEHWLTSLNREQMLLILEQEKRKKAYEMGLLSLEEYEGEDEVDIELSYAQSLIGQEISYVKDDGSVGTMVVEDIKVVDGEVIMGGGKESVPLESVPDVDGKIDKYVEENPDVIKPETDGGELGPGEYDDDDPYRQWLGDPPPPYKTWLDVPFDIIWKHAMEKHN